MEEVYLCKIGRRIIEKSIYFRFGFAGVMFSDVQEKLRVLITSEVAVAAHVDVIFAYIERKFGLA